MPPEMLVNIKPEFVAPFVAAVTHPDGPDASGKVYEVGAGFIAEVRWERSKGHVFKTDDTFTPSAVRVSFRMVAFSACSASGHRFPTTGTRSPTLRTRISEILVETPAQTDS